MDLLLVVSNKGERTLLRVETGIRYEDLLIEVNGKWPIVGDAKFKYSVGSYMNCLLKSEVDFSNMCMLAKAIRCECIEIEIVDEHKSCQDRELSNSQEPLPQFDVNDVRGSAATLVDKKRKLNEFNNLDKPSLHGGGLADELFNMYSDFDIRNIDRELASGSTGLGEKEYQGVNAMPIYDVCPDIEKIPLLSDGWENCITGEGQLFRQGRQEFKVALTKYATKIGFHFNFAKNNKDYVYVECTEKSVGSGCRWVIRGKEEAVSGVFRIHHAVLVHDCLGKLVVNDHGRIGPKLWGSLVMEQVRNKPHHKGTVMKDYIQTNFGLEIPYFTAYRAMESARDRIFGSFQTSYDQLEWWGEAAAKKNPGSVIEMETEDNLDDIAAEGNLQAAVSASMVAKRKRTFKRSFYAFDACLEGFKFCRPMLFVDACHMIGRWSGTILTATGKDGNNGLFPVAFAIVIAENFDNWVWFLSKLKDLVKHEKKVWYVSDRNTGLMSAFPAVFHEPTHFYCLFHLHTNLKGYYAGPYSNQHRKDMCTLLTECAYAPDKRLFAIAVSKFKAKGGRLADRFLQELPYEKWAFSYSRHIQRFGEMTSNAAESFNSWIKLARTLPVTYMVDTIRSDIMRWYVERRRESTSWHSKLCARRQDIWNYHTELSRSWFVTECPNGNYKVLSQTSVEVNVQARTCSCAQWEIHGFPCAHAVAAIRKGKFKIEEVIEPCFFTTTYQRCYERNINPIADTDKFNCPAFTSDIQILPPPSKNKPGRPKEKRLKSYGEVPKMRKTVCTICGILSRHDLITCSKAP